MNIIHTFSSLIKKNIFSILFILFAFFLVVFSKQNLNATQQGLILCANSVIPALFPFFIASELLNYTNIVSLIGLKLNKIMKPLFNVPGQGAYCFIMRNNKWLSYRC